MSRYALLLIGISVLLVGCTSAEEKPVDPREAARRRARDAGLHVRQRLEALGVTPQGGPVWIWTGPPPPDVRVSLRATLALLIPADVVQYETFGGELAKEAARSAGPVLAEFVWLDNVAGLYNPLPAISFDVQTLDLVTVEPMKSGVERSLVRIQAACSRELTRKLEALGVAPLAPLEPAPDEPPPATLKTVSFKIRDVLQQLGLELAPWFPLPQSATWSMIPCAPATPPVASPGGPIDALVQFFGSKGASLAKDPRAPGTTWEFDTEKEALLVRDTQPRIERLLEVILRTKAALDTPPSPH